MRFPFLAVTRVIDGRRLSGQASNKQRGCFQAQISVRRSPGGSISKHTPLEKRAKVLIKTSSILKVLEITDTTAF
ncbi:hypothetical protein [Rhodoferax sp. PAMC 29310]|uniref:hypothetical protein n=1 Tax=Rhodoferax sp. PAMC 29310 TaxID=2822760 RepID=UPI001B32AE65|nr:hypothetical protein [Rhodoferax sp. PAMC 29310]